MTPEPERDWQEEDSRTFIDWGTYFVPGRERQIQIICDLIPSRPGPFHILELCCGEGLLAETLLARFPHCTVHGYDGSEEMRRHAQARLATYGDRFQTEAFALADDAWRVPPWPVHAVVSSLCIHHLDGAQKQALYRDVYGMLQADGVFLIADLIQPTTVRGAAVAADAWDRTVRQRALERDGDETAWHRFRRERWNHFRYPDPSDKPSPLLDQLQWLAQAGFTADVYWMKAGHAVFGGYKPA